MAKVQAINFFDKENWSSGGGFFPDGPGTILSARFGTYDFGTAGNDSVCMILTAQPMTADGKPNGDEKIQYYPVGKGVELVNPVKGEKGMYSGIGLAEDSEYDKLFRFSDFIIFMEHLEKAGYDMDAAEGDITVLDGLEVEFVKIEKAANPNKKKSKDDDGDDEKDKKPRQVVVVGALADGKKPATKGKSESKPEAKAPAKGKDKGKAEVGDSPEEVVEAYLESILTEDNDGKQALGLKMGCAAWATKTLDKGADEARKAQAYLKENWEALLSANGWSMSGSKIVKD